MYGVDLEHTNPYVNVMTARRGPPPSKKTTSKKTLATKARTTKAPARSRAGGRGEAASAPTERARATATSARVEGATSDDARKRVPAQTRAELIAAASRLFLRDGLDTPSLDAICEEAGYTRGAFYVHFGSREALVAAVVESAFSELVERIVRPEEELFAIIDAFVTALAGGAVPIRGKTQLSQVLEACARSWDLRVKFLAVLVSAKHRIAEAVRRSQERDAVRLDAAPEAIAELLIALVLGVHVAAQLGAPYDAEAVARELRTMLTPPSAPAARPRTRATRRGASNPSSQED